MQLSIKKLMRSINMASIVEKGDQGLFAVVIRGPDAKMKGSIAYLLRCKMTFAHEDKKAEKTNAWLPGED